MLFVRCIWQLLAPNGRGDCIAHVRSGGKAGKHLIAVSISACDPTATLGLAGKPHYCLINSIDGTRETLAQERGQRQSAPVLAWPKSLVTPPPLLTEPGLPLNESARNQTQHREELCCNPGMG